MRSWAWSFSAPRFFAVISFTKPVCWPQTVKETSCRLWFLRLAIVSAFLFTLTFICQCFFLDFFPYFFLFFFLILQLLLLPLFALRTIAKFYAILRLGLLPLSFLDFFGAKHTHISGLCHEVISFLFRCAHQSVSEMLKCLWSNIGCLVKMGTCKSSQICIGPRGVWVTYLWSSFPL